MAKDKKVSTMEQRGETLKDMNVNKHKYPRNRFVSEEELGREYVKQPRPYRSFIKRCPNCSD